MVLSKDEARTVPEQEEQGFRLRRHCPLLGSSLGWDTCPLTTEVPPALEQLCPGPAVGWRVSCRNPGPSGDPLIIEPSPWAQMPRRADVIRKEALNKIATKRSSKVSLEAFLEVAA